MDKIRVLVVDDSPFSQKVIAGALDVPGFEICGMADTGRDGIEKYRLLQPDAVTMDVTMPDMDGLTCSREILAQWPEARIILVSSMKDETLIAQGRAIGVVSFLQKPVKSAQLATAIRQACLRQTEDDAFSDRYAELFRSALEDNLQDIVPDCTVSLANEAGWAFTSQGLAVVMGITGKRQGRIILDMSAATAAAFTEMMLGKPPANEEEIHYSVAEFANIVNGHGISYINNQFASMDLRLTPPGIIFGSEISIVNPKLQSTVIYADTSVGRIALSVGFAGGKQLGC